MMFCDVRRLTAKGIEHVGSIEVSQDIDSELQPIYRVTVRGIGRSSVDRFSIPCYAAKKERERELFVLNRIVKTLMARVDTENFEERV